MAAYGTHPSITGETHASPASAQPRSSSSIRPIRPIPTIPADAADFMFSNGPTWGNDANGVTNTGLDKVDLWVGGLAEVTNLFGGLLGSTFNYVFQTQLEKLQDGDRLYYLARTPGMNLRTQLEGNSFSELIQRNTDDTNSLKADAFATADCKFQLANLAGTAAGFDLQRLPRRRRPDDGLQRDPAAPPPSRRHDRVPGTQHGRPVRHQRPVGLQRHARCRPRHRRQRQRHLLGCATATTSSKATAATTSLSVAMATTSSPTSTVPTCSRAAPATTPSTPAPATTS